MNIDDYAYSMFRFEHLHPAWITRCAQYLTHVFGDSLRDATVIDYACGRGNWSLAFREAGARNVIAIDMAPSNIARLSEYLSRYSIDGIEVVEQDILDYPIAPRADILWVYGILQHFDDPTKLLSRLPGMWRDPAKGLGLLYSYDRFSLRQVVVDMARQALTYQSYRAFHEDSLLFNPHTRLRVRDDLTAPKVEWFSKSALVALVTNASAHASAFVPSFTDFEQTTTGEFSPHHLLFCGTANPRASSLAVTNEREDLRIDERIIFEFGSAAMSAVSSTQAKKLAVGLVNTHFAALAHSGYEKTLIEDYLYLLYAYKTLELRPRSELQAEVLRASTRALESRSGTNRCSAEMEHSLIMAFLSTNSIRI